MASKGRFYDWVEYLRAVAFEKSESVPFVDLDLDEEGQNVGKLYLPLSIKTVEGATAMASLCSRHLAENTEQAGVVDGSEVRDAAQDLEEILCPDDKKPVRCLLRSPPGCGKTMTCYQILHLWVSGKCFKRFEAVVYLTGRDEERLTAQKLEEFLPGFDEPKFKDRLTTKLILEYLEKHGEKLLIIVDAADESSRSDSLFRLKDKGPQSILATLFSQAKSLSSDLGKLTSASVIVTSRPCPATEHLIRHRRCDVLSLDGFTDDSVQQLFEKRMGRERSECLWGELNKPDHEQLKDTIVEVPLLAAMIAVLYEEYQALPSTVAEIYEIMEEYLALRSEKRKGIVCDTPEAKEQLLYRAYHRLTKREFTLTEEDIQFSGQAAKLALDTGILRKNPKKVSQRLQETYRFSHLTWQEFMAACWIAKNAVTHLSTSVNKIRLVDQRKFFWRLVSGLLCDVDHLVHLVEALRGESNKNGSFSAGECLFLISCILEWIKKSGSTPAPTSDVSKALMRSICSSYSDQPMFLLSGHRFSTKDAHAVSAVFQYFQIRTISFLCCAMDSDHCALVGDHLAMLTHLTLEYVNFEDSLAGFKGLVKHLSQLVWLKVNYCGLSHPHARVVKQLMRRNRKLETLYLIGNNLQTSGVLTVCEGITEGSLLHTLMLHGNDLGSNFDGDKVGRALVNAKNLKSVDFTQNSLSSKHLESFLPHLADHAHVEDIWLRRNNFDDRSLDHIESFLRQRNKHLTSPSITVGGNPADLSNSVSVTQSSVKIHLESNNGITEDGLRCLASKLPASFGDKIYWNCLVVKPQKFCDEDYEEPMRLAKGRRKGRVWLNNYGMTDRAVKMFVERQLLQNHKVQLDLMLDYNNIGDEGAKSLAEGLKYSRNIRMLILEYNNIGIAGLRKILDALEQNEHDLAVLVVKENPIFRGVSPDDGFYHLSNSLRYLDLSSTNMDAGHGCQLANLLTVHPTLHFLLLSNNDLGDKFAVSLGDCLSRNRALSLIELSSTGIADGGAGRLYDSLAKKGADTSTARVDAGRERLSNTLSTKDGETCVECIWLAGNQISPSIFRPPLVNSRLRKLLPGQILELIPTVPGSKEDE